MCIRDSRLSVCRVVLQSTRVRHERLAADKSLASSYNILVRRVRHARFSRDMLATFSRGCHEDATRMLRASCSREISALVRRDALHRTVPAPRCAATQRAGSGVKDAHQLISHVSISRYTFFCIACRAQHWPTVSSQWRYESYSQQANGNFIFMGQWY